ncbi:MAG: hypothetical protein EBU28_05210 [Gammaproteobacteria bacterium]|jgi:hypothetical protein|nr:hypothetical protein [Gammaproteobacteria bacterium]
MPARRKPPPEWWLLGYLVQYQRTDLFKEIEALGGDPQLLYRAAAVSAEKLPSADYRRLAKAWAVRQHRLKKQS